MSEVSKNSFDLVGSQNKDTTYSQYLSLTEYQKRCLPATNYWRKRNGVPPILIPPDKPVLPLQHSTCVHTEDMDMRLNDQTWDSEGPSYNDHSVQRVYPNVTPVRETGSVFKYDILEIIKGGTENE